MCSSTKTLMLLIQYNKSLKFIENGAKLMVQLIKFLTHCDLKGLEFSIIICLNLREFK
jgi:hypothetical protein